MNNATSNWQDSLAQTYQEFYTQIIAYSPQILGALLFLFIGWLAAHALRIAIKKLIGGLDTLFQRMFKSDHAAHERVKRSYSVIISGAVFWIVIIFSIAAAANMLGWDMFSNWLGNVITYLPNLITGLLIILAGFLLGNGAKSATFGAATAAGIEQVELVGRSVQVIIMFTALVIGVEQIGINIGFITNVSLVIIGVLSAGGALAFGLGAKDLIANVIGAQYTRKHCRIGEHMQIGTAQGVVIEVSQTSIVLDNGVARVVVPAKLFHEMSSTLSPDADNIGLTTKTEQDSQHV